MKRGLGEVINALDQSILYRLIVSKALCFKFIRRVFKEQPNLFSKEMLKQVCDSIQDDEECRGELWKCLDVFLPETMSKEQKLLTLEYGILHELIHLELLRKEEENKRKEEEKKLVISS